MLKVEHTFDLGNLYNHWFIDSEICLSTKLNLIKKTDLNLFIVTTAELSIFLSDFSADRINKKVNFIAFLFWFQPVVSLGWAKAFQSALSAALVYVISLLY